MLSDYRNPSLILFLSLTTFLLLLSFSTSVHSRSHTHRHHRQPPHLQDSLTYLWPLPSNFTSGNQTLTVDPNLSLSVNGYTYGGSVILQQAFQRYKSLIFTHSSNLFGTGIDYDVNWINIIVHSDDEELQLGTDESYSLVVTKTDDHSIVGGITIEANTVYGALRGLETLSQLCVFNYEAKTVQVCKAPWFIQDKPRFAYRGLLLDTSRHYYPVTVIKQIIDSMAYAKL